MRKFLFLIVAILVTSITNLSAKEGLASKNPLPVVKSDEIVLKLDLGKMTDMSSSEIQKRIYEFIEKNISKTSELTCTVTVTGTVDVGIAEFEISVSVSGPCAEVAKEGKNIATRILNEITDTIKKALD